MELVMEYKDNKSLNPKMSDKLNRIHKRVEKIM